MPLKKFVPYLYGKHCESRLADGTICGAYFKKPKRTSKVCPNCQKRNREISHKKKA